MNQPLESNSGGGPGASPQPGPGASPQPSQSRRIRVALLFGGRSGEHSVSCVTAGSLLQAIDRDRFEPVPVGIGLDGLWTLQPDDPTPLRAQDGRLPQVEAAGPEVLPPDRAGSRQWRIINNTGQVETLEPIDVTFPLFHGPYGEDGTIQGLLDLTDQPYVGSGVLASAIGMDKRYMKCVLEAAGLPVGPYEALDPGQWQRQPEAVAARAARLGYPLFVKPCRAGSSLGISRVDQPSGLAAAIELAQRHDRRVLIEAMIQGREIECAVLESPDGGPPRVAPPSEIVVGSGYQFYDFESKYLDASGADLRCPADLPPGVTERLQDLAGRTFQAIGGEGLSRVDFFYDELAAPGRQVIVNEINTMPGFTPISQYPRMWQVAGLDYTALVSQLIDLALARPTGLR
ncbi:MAG: D-alanine--D-alanine ligase [Bifidobacteriaceae bacterium]|jgi:D-alanine-D-alanine ligase|nr:D-alanine--D-alanine ligase [Bifidobacteriaceae bacterium]